MDYKFACFTTGAVTLSTTAGGTVTQNISIEQDAPFECHYITGLLLQANVIVTNWGGTVQITDSRVNKGLFNNPIGFMEIAGDGRQPYPLKYPRLFAANSTLVVAFTNNVVTAGTAQLTLHGFKVYN